ncbi:hypothetical protein ACJX0J_003484, partial (mitochondrion) [Zea mays]
LILLVAMIGAIQSLVVSEWHSFRIRSCGRINVSKRMSNRTSQIVIVQYEWCLDARKNGRGR